MVKPALILPPEPDERWQLSSQLGVTKVVIHPLEIGDGQTSWSYNEIQQLKNWLGSANLELSVIEGSVPITDKTRLGLDGRDNEIEEFKDFLRNLGKLGVSTVAYDWMARIRWARTDSHIPLRGNSFTTGFDCEKIQPHSVPSADDVSHDDLWANLKYFLKEVVPVAEKAGVKLALHPDDPPRSELQGIPRIITGVEEYDRVLNIYDSEYNGITFGQGNFAAMNVDIPEAIRHFGDRINFAHFRDVRGNADKFIETWHDNGPTDMLEAMKAYYEIGFDGVIRPDHVPSMVGEQNTNPGYETKGRIFAIGYMKGLMQAAEKRASQ